jgi:hypothetical protein
MIFHVAAMTLVERSYDAADREEAIQAFVRDGGFSCIEDAAEAEVLDVEEYRASLIVRQKNFDGADID